jgi:hypothetical protein
MPGCILRVSGSTKIVRAFTARTSLPVCAVFIHGEPVSSGTKRLVKGSGFNVTVGRAKGSLAAQVRSAMRFFNNHAIELRRMEAAFKRGSPVLDFGLSVFENQFVHSYRLPPAFLKLAGQHGFHVRISLYPTAAAG